MPLSYKEVAEILKVIDASEVDEVVLELEGTRLVVRRAGSAAAPQPTATAAPAVETPQTQAPASAASVPAAPKAEPGEGTVIKSPMVGTFYRRPSPDDPPFVEKGGKVEPGDALCLIEVMKLYTTIEATAAGTVTSILAENAQLVEFDQPLFTIKED